jgi:hypothetical protein
MNVGMDIHTKTSETTVHTVYMATFSCAGQAVWRSLKTSQDVEAHGLVKTCKAQSAHFPDLGVLLHSARIINQMKGTTQRTP